MSPPANARYVLLLEVESAQSECEKPNLIALL